MTAPQTTILVTNYKSANDVFAQIDELTKAYKKQFKKNPSVDLVYSSSGDPKKPSHNLAVWHDGSMTQNEEIIFFFEQIS